MNDLPTGAASFPVPASPEPGSGTPEKPNNQPSPPAEKPRRSIWRRLLVWLLVLLIVFSLGAFVAFYSLYLPERQGFETLQVDLVKANQRISELENRVNTLSGLESKNKELQSSINETNLHINILKARIDVATALLALAKDDPTRARVALSRTGQTLDTIKGLLDPGQQKAADDMQARLKLALGEVGDQAFAAESDLNVLATSLMEMENVYFTGP